MVTLEGVTHACTENLEACSLVSSLVLERNSHATNSVDNAGESTEVNIDVVVDADIEVFFQSANQSVGIVLVEVGIDAVTT